MRSYAAVLGRRLPRRNLVLLVVLGKNGCQRSLGTTNLLRLQPVLRNRETEDENLQAPERLSAGPVLQQTIQKLALASTRPRGHGCTPVLQQTPEGLSAKLVLQQTMQKLLPAATQTPKHEDVPG